MKSQLLRTSILVLAAAAGVYAQAARQFKANIPFDFAAGNRTLPAGEYTVDQMIAGRVILKSADQKRGILVLGNAIRSVGSQKDAKLVFHRYGNYYFLAEVWASAIDSGNQVPKSRLESELAARQPAPERIIVAATR
jgi:hypothetical protein